jgi:hypothetical protein
VDRTEAPRKQEARWLSTEDQLPEPGELAYVFVFSYEGQKLVFKTPQGLGDSIAGDLEEMTEGAQATITVETMTAEVLGNLPEFEGW